MTGFYGNKGLQSVHKFGRNSLINTGSTPEDIWEVGGTNPTPVIESQITVVSSSASDTSAGTGARTIFVEGVDGNGLVVSETATLNGLTNVILANNYMFINRVKVVTAGSTGSNVGQITFTHSDGVIASVEATRNQTLQAIYFVPSNYKVSFLAAVSASVMKTNTTVVDVELLVKEWGSVWQTKFTETLRSTSTASVNYAYPFSESIEPMSYVKWVCTSASSNSTVVNARFDIGLQK